MKNITITIKPKDKEFLVYVNGNMEKVAKEEQEVIEIVKNALNRELLVCHTCNQPLLNKIKR